jgi:FMN phosphatase YigB (HAD superfamily)
MFWEYILVELGRGPASGLKAILDQKGREGWELAAITNGLDIFKRSVSWEGNVR